MTNEKNNSGKYSGLVWIISSLSLAAYGVLSLTNQNIPGVEQLVDYPSTIDSTHIYIAAFLSILIEGLYVIGSFFPGSSLVVLISIISQVSGTAAFLITIFVIFLGWCVAGAINIALAKLYGIKVLRRSDDPTHIVKGRILTTWFPSFRANYEVSQVVEGGNPYKIFWSSVKVKFLVSVFMFGCLALVPLFIDINTVTNKEGSISIFTIAGISFIVGVVKIRKYTQSHVR
jgi:hypothetical protein